MDFSEEVLHIFLIFIFSYFLCYGIYIYIFFNSNFEFFGHYCREIELFLYINLVSYNLVKLSFVLVDFFCCSLALFTYKIMLSANRDFLIPSQLYAFFVSCVIARASTSYTMLNGSGESRHLCFICEH